MLKPFNIIKNIFENTCGETFAFFAQDVCFETCPSHFRLSMIPSQKTCLHCELLVKINLLVKLCARNYATSDGLINGANGIFKDYIETSTSKSFIWIYFENPRIGNNTRFKKIIYINNFQG
jgi:hypothetical protein